ncbi:PstS family phosphate ABC transporter substrate-binding protein [Daeguia caeni]|uniref:PstS family phosphate ABC transporter substrate-binding protein n=1 Tax=Daeguia caeni TaxID=439612 RepID=A0ABV9H9S5_9HYPH
MKMMISTTAAFAIAAVLSASSASAREQVQIAGSSTVLPYSKIVAETFGEIYPDFKTPVVESGGSGAGIKEFCKGVGENTIDIANASRPMKDSELKSCIDAGVKEVQEVRFGYDGIVFATDAKGPEWNLKPEDVYKALAARLVIDGKLVDNPYRRWSEVNPDLPDWEIAAYIPGEKHGTREVFEEKVLAEGCQHSGALDEIRKTGLDDKAAAAACIAVRKDGKAVDIDGDYSETLARIGSNKTGIGVFGLYFFENNADKLRVATINGVTPSAETVASGEYSVSRPLYFYVKKAHLGVVPGLKEFVDFFLSEQMVGPDGPLADYGLVPAPDAEREEQRVNFAEGRILEIKN